VTDEIEDVASPDTPEAERGERIAKYLARAGIASRRDAEKLIAEGKVKMNGKVVATPATFVAEGARISVEGKPVQPAERTRLFRHHKPDGVVTTHKDPQGRPTVFERLPPAIGRVVSIGRLDLTSEGLLLLTNDGELARKLELPSNGWLRRYRVRVYGVVDEKSLAALARGITVDGVAYGPIEAGLDSRRGAIAWLTVSLKEGKNREIRRVMQHLGLHVTRLIRTAYGPFQLGTLPKGGVEEVHPKVMREQLGIGEAPQKKRRREQEEAAAAAAAAPPPVAPPAKPKRVRPENIPRARNAEPPRPKHVANRRRKPSGP
jgi:23S rRNA pseudouridine2605 synthase